MGLLVFFFGVVLITKREFRRASIAAAAGTAAFLFSTELAMPFFAGGVGGHYWPYSELGPSTGTAIRNVLKDPVLLLRNLVSPSEKVKTLVATVRPFYFLALLSPLILLAIPLLAERFLSNDPQFWGTQFHLAATTAPIVAMATADGVRNGLNFVKHRYPSIQSRQEVWICAAAGALAVLLSFANVSGQPLWSLTQASYYKPFPGQQIGYEALSKIPPSASVVAQDAVAAHLTEREKIYYLDAKHVKYARYVIATSTLTPWPNASYQVIHGVLDRYVKDGYSVIFSRGGWTVLRSGWASVG